MQLSFRFLSSDVSSKDSIDLELRQRLSEIVHRGGNDTPVLAGSTSGLVVTLAVQIRHDEHGLPEALEDLLHCLAEFGSLHHLAWQISHDHDDEVAILNHGDGVKVAGEQIAMACEIAKLMADDFEQTLDAIPEQELGDLVGPKEATASWTDLANPHDSFIRFPEWSDEDDEPEAPFLQND
ncbi:MAG: hypothetical protein AAFV88_15395 [Planctomycetota bacterium]